MPYGTRAGRMAYSSPPWLQGPYGLSWNAGVGDGLDGLLDDAKAAVKARMPLEAAGNDDDQALALIGTDSSLPRYPSETTEQYGARLQARWQTYDRAGGVPRASDGTGCPILDDLEGLGFGNITLMEYRDWPADGSDPNVHHSPGSWYDSTGTTPWWSRFWIYIQKYNGANISEGGVLGTGVLGTMYLGFELPADVVASAVDAVIRWKPAHVLCVSIVFLTEGTPMDNVLGYGILGTMTLGSSGMLPGTSAVEINR